MFSNWKKFLTGHRTYDTPYYRRLLQLGWEPPSSITEGWKPPKGTLLRAIWDVPLEQTPEVRKRWYAEQARVREQSGNKN